MYFLELKVLGRLGELVVGISKIRGTNEKVMNEVNSLQIYES